MGPVRTPITLTNPAEPGFARLEVDALVGTGAVHLCIPESVSFQLGLAEFEKREVTMADGSQRLVSYVGPIRTSFRNRSGLTDAMVLGREVLLGTIPMDDMDLVVRPLSRDVAPNPQSPDIPASFAMGELYPTND